LKKPKILKKKSGGLGADRAPGGVQGKALARGPGGRRPPEAPAF